MKSDCVNAYFFGSMGSGRVSSVFGVMFFGWESSMKKLKVLIADDDRPAHELYNHCLLGELYEKHMVDNGEEAVKAYETWQPDVIILDIMMPVMSGYQALKEIRRTEKENAKPPTPILMVTALGSKSDIVDCMKQGIQGYIVKPFRPDDLCEKVELGYKKLNPSG